MLKSISKYTYKLSVSVFFAWLLMSAAGFVDIVYAVSCNDRVNATTTTTYSSALTNFLYYGGKTYAIAMPGSYFAMNAGISREYYYDGVDSASLKALLSTSKYGAARPVSISSEAIKDFILNYYGPLIGNTYIDAWKDYGAANFATINGAALSYTNWITAPTITTPPSAVMMSGDGLWSPITWSSTAPTPTAISQIVEFDGQLDCAIDPNAGGGGGGGTGGGGTGGGTGTGTTGLICSQDLNNNGYVGETGEIASCIETDQGNLCPVGALDCNAGYQDPVCPAGSALNTVRDMCQADPLSVTCPIGYSWDQGIDKCVKSPSCSEGGIYNAITDRCEKLAQDSCPEGYDLVTNTSYISFDPTITTPTDQQLCVKAIDCSPGSFNSARDRCESPVIWSCPVGYSFNSESGTCDALPSCPDGWSYDTTTNRCQQPPGTCPTGYNYNAVLDQCVASATCTGGGVLNGTSDSCELGAASSCQLGWVYNAGTAKCEQAPTCAVPGAYSALNNICMTPTAGTGCPDGYIYNTTFATCTAAPVCNSGAYNNATDRCESSPSYSCSDPSYTYNSTSGRCEKSPVCPAGMTYNATYNVCAQAINQSCPAGYALNTTRNRCEKQPPECPVGATYNATTNKCESAATPPSTYDATLTGGMVVHALSVYAGYGGIWVPGYVATSPFAGSVRCDNICGDSINMGRSISCKNVPGPLYCNSAAMAAVVYGTTETCDENGCTSVQWEYYYPQEPNSTGGVYSCPGGGTLSGTTCTVGTATCPDGSIPVNGVCQANPTCTGGSFDTTNDVCYTDYTPACSQGTYDSASGLCIIAPTCSNGLLDASADVCYQAPSTGCANGYTLSGNVCIASPSCTVPGSFSAGSVDLCQTPANYSCPSGYTYSTTYGQCYQAANCNGGGLNIASDICEMVYTSTCPDGYILNGAVCQAVPVCEIGGSYNASVNLCSSNTGACSAGLLDPSLDVCYQAAGCTGGTLNTSRDRCEAVATPSCGSLSYDSTNLICYSQPVCSSGTFSVSTDRCEAAATKSCGAYIWNETDQKCTQPASCPTDPNFPLANSIALDTTLDTCLSSAVHTCATGLAWNSLPVLKCEAAPVCNGAIYYDITTHSCLMSVDCPYGSQYSCILNPNTSTQQCSPNACVNTGTDDPEIDDDPEDPYYQDDGDRDADGNCLGTVYIFSGKPSRCRPAGWTVGMINDCCAGGNGISEDTGESPLGLMGTSIKTIYEMARAAYYAKLGYDTVQAAMATGSSAAEAMALAANLVDQAVDAGGMTASAASSYLAGASGASNGLSSSATITSALSDIAKSGLAAAAVWAAGAIVSAIGGDQDAVAAAQIAATLALMSGPQAIIGVIIIVVMRVLMGSGCDQNDITTANFVESKRCHFVGDYCEKKWAMVGCVQQAKGYCCFNSMLARIINEQGRPQLTVFGPSGGWGPAHNPECRGFTPDEFQSLDFNRIDMTEYYSVVEKDMASKIQTSQEKINETIQFKFQQIQGN